MLEDVEGDDQTERGVAERQSPGVGPHRGQASLVRDGGALRPVLHSYRCPPEVAQDPGVPASGGTDVERPPGSDPREGPGE